jgi:ABC-type transport system involved in multi-copper enzyme maturation permease subunit
MLSELFYYDLIRLARRGRTTVLRTAYALSLLVALFLAYQRSFPLQPFWETPSLRLQERSPAPANELARLALRFVRALLQVQSLAIFVLTPAYLAPAIAEEKQRGTLDLLFTTHLSDREIIAGKLLARTVHLGGVLLAGMPLLALVQLWGGVDARLLVAAFVTTGLNLLSVGSVCLLCSVEARTVIGALFASYVATAVLYVWSIFVPATPVATFDLAAEGLLASTNDSAGSPSVMSWALAFRPLILCSVVNGAVFALGFGCAVLNVRPTSGLPGWEHNFQAGPWSRSVPEVSQSWFPDLASALPAKEANSCAVSDNWPLLWKEAFRGGIDADSRRIEQYVGQHWRRIASVVVPVVVLILILRRAGLDPCLLYPFHLLASFALFLSAGFWCGVASFRAAGSFCRERDQHTLESLLILPVSSASIAGAKWLGPLLHGRIFAYCAACALVVDVCSGELHPTGALLTVMAIVAHCCFLTSVGTRLSVFFRNSRQALLTMALILLIFFGGGLGWLVNAAPSWFISNPWRPPVAQVGVNALAAWSVLSFSPEEFRRMEPPFAMQLRVAGGGIPVFALAAAVLWLDMVRCVRAARAR